MNRVNYRMVGDFQVIVQGYLERSQVASKMADDGRWSESAELLKQLMADVRCSKIQPGMKEDHDGKTVSC